MELSVVIPVFESYEIVRRQLRHLERMCNKVRRNVEFIMIDDGSDPPIDFTNHLKYFIGRCTNNTVPWSEHAARNLGAHLAHGRNLFLIDIDYIIPERTLLKALGFQGDRMAIRRSFGYLDENGDIVTDKQSLSEWGLADEYLPYDHVPGHRSQFVMRRDLFFKLGGYREDLAGVNHPMGGGPGQQFWRKWQRLAKRKRAKLSNRQAYVFMFPMGKFHQTGSYNPHGLFHDLKREPIDWDLVAKRQERARSKRGDTGSQ